MLGEPLDPIRIHRLSSAPITWTTSAARRRRCRPREHDLRGPLVRPLASRRPLAVPHDYSRKNAAARMRRAATEETDANHADRVRISRCGRGADGTGDGIGPRCAGVAAGDRSTPPRFRNVEAAWRPLVGARKRSSATTEGAVPATPPARRHRCRRPASRRGGGAGAGRGRRRRADRAGRCRCTATPRRDRRSSIRISP